MKYITFFIALVFINHSCARDNISNEDNGIPTVIKGKVTDDMRGLNIENYKIKLVKSWDCCSNFMCGICSEEIATVYTDKNGDFSITFNYKLKNSERYGLEEQYYGNPYLAEYTQIDQIKVGAENIIRINALKPITLKLNLDIKNNENSPLTTGLNYNNNYTFGTEFTYEKDIKKTVQIRARPNSDILIEFWYYKGLDSWGNPIKHLKSLPYKTNLNDVTELNFEIDCSKF